VERSRPHHLGSEEHEVFSWHRLVSRDRGPETPTVEFALILRINEIEGDYARHIQPVNRRAVARQ
jgi:hypothetical protein